MYVRDIMTTNVVTIPSSTCISEAKRIMQAHRFRRVGQVFDRVGQGRRRCDHPGRAQLRGIRRGARQRRADAPQRALRGWNRQRSQGRC